MSTLGPQAVRLAAGAGLVLDPWQQLVLDVWLGQTEAGSWAAYELGCIVARQQGKGSILEAFELFKLFALREPLILHTAHQFKTAMEHWHRITGLIRSTPMLHERVAHYPKNPSQYGVELKTGERLLIVARSGSSGRGYSASTVVCDEAMDLGDTEMAALQPTQNAISDPQFVYTGSAPMATSDQLHSVRARALDGSSPRLAFLEWSAPEDCDHADRRAWAQATPALGYRTSEQSVADSHAALSPDVFGREILSIPDAPLGQATIPFGAWAGCRDARSEATGRLVFAVAVSFPNRDRAAIGVCGMRKDRTPHIEVVDHRPGTDWVLPRLTELTRRWRPGALLIDPGGPEGSLVRDLADAKIEPRLVTAREYGQACGAFYDAVIKNGLRHLGQSELDAAVRDATKRDLGEAWAWDGKAGTDITTLKAVTLAFWGVSNRPNSVRVVNLAALGEEQNNGGTGQPDSAG